MYLQHYGVPWVGVPRHAWPETLLMPPPADADAEGNRDHPPLAPKPEIVNRTAQNECLQIRLLDVLIR